jgi:hypothetical protein
MAASLSRPVRQLQVLHGRSYPQPEYILNACVRFSSVEVEHAARLDAAAFSRFLSYGFRDEWMID